MKLSVIILAFYVALISCFPCQDVPVRIAFDSDFNAGIEHKDTDHKDEPGDSCSPFCICTCCASVSLPPLAFGFAPPTSVPNTPEKSFEYKSSLDQSDTGLIWQPPRLV